MRNAFLSSGRDVKVVLSLVLLLALSLSIAVGQEPYADPITEEIDLEFWVKEYSKLGNTAFSRGEFYMRSKRRDRFYYVLVAPEDYTTSGSNVTVTLRNVHGLRTQLGYGLLFHSDPQPLVQDYVFVIDTITRRYRVARHAANKEKDVIKWTRSSLILGGRKENVLEVRDKGSSVDLYINHRFVRSVDTPLAYKMGQPGLYTDAIPIAFKKFVVIAEDRKRSRTISKFDQKPLSSNQKAP
ncbi:MAG: hypothetical protein QM785_00140 [Pyrinomonadaceae bacterium]